MHLVYPAGMGMGDVKLALLLGAALGWLVVLALFVGSLGVGLAGVVFLVREGRAARKKAIPFGPFLALGAIAALFLGGPSRRPPSFLHLPGVVESLKLGQ